MDDGDILLFNIYFLDDYDWSAWASSWCNAFKRYRDTVTAQSLVGQYQRYSLHFFHEVFMGGFPSQHAPPAINS